MTRKTPTRHDADGATACAKCPNGRYQSAPGQQRCEACEAGRAAELTAASPLNVQCDACDAGGCDAGRCDPGGGGGGAAATAAAAAAAFWRSRTQPS